MTRDKQSVGWSNESFDQVLARAIKVAEKYPPPFGPQPRDWERVVDLEETYFVPFRILEKQVFQLVFSGKMTATAIQETVCPRVTETHKELEGGSAARPDVKDVELRRAVPFKNPARRPLVVKLLERLWGAVGH